MEVTKITQTQKQESHPLIDPYKGHVIEMQREVNKLKIFKGDLIRFNDMNNEKEGRVETNPAFDYQRSWRVCL